ncbi:MAG: 2-oxo acid dehydrogenase subunit E2 [Planctomycetales bacterium]
MALEFRLPALGEGVNSADVATILVSEGDSVSAGQNLMELETEKAVVELPAPQAAKISKILVKSGQTIKPGDPVIVFDGAADAAPVARPQAPAPAAAPVPSSAASSPAPAPSQPAPKAAAPASGSTGTHEVRLPELGEGVKSADVAGILVNEGDSVTAGQNLLELETEKAVVELPSPATGKITKIHVKSGATLKPGDLVFTITGSGSAAPASSPAPTAPAAPAPQAAAATAAAQPAAPASKPVASPQVAAPAGDDNRAPAPAGPATRRLARELGVDLHLVAGSGPGGRITHEDLQDFVKKIMTGEKPSPGASGGTGVAALPLPDFTQWGSVERKAMNKIAKTAMTNLSYAWQTIPHVTQHDLADITDLEAGRKRSSSVPGAPKITMTVLAIKAVVAALKQFPHFNSSLDTKTNEVIYKQYYNIGVAVDTEQGLVVPVIKDANLKSVMEIAKELDVLAAKARERKLAISDFQGATFTISNLGGIGGTSFTPIVNWPEVAILGMSRSREQLVVVKGEAKPRLMLPLSLSYDHRVINGADAARFIVKISGLLADPSLLLIES